MIALADGRKVEIAEYGDPQGTPALWFHGGFSSRLEASFLDDAARARGVRLLALDRAGAGGSDPLPGRTVMGYAEDVRQVLDALDIGTTAVAGLSAGGMYTMAVASALPERVSHAVPVNSSTPIADKAALGALSLKGRMSYAYVQRNADKIARRLDGAEPAGRLATWLSRRANPDAAVLAADPEKGAAWARNVAEVGRQGGGFVADEIRLSMADWGFDHRAVPVRVTVVNGEADAGLGYARVWADELPDGRFLLVPCGHNAVLYDEPARRIVEALAS